MTSYTLHTTKMTSLSNNDNSNAQTTGGLRSLHWWEWQQLQRQGCTASDWGSVRISERTDLNLIHNVDFEGTVHIHALQREITLPGGHFPQLRNALISNCRIGDNASIAYIPSGLRNAVIGSEAVISNVDRLEFEPEALCGVGIKVDVLDETGSRPVCIFPGLSAQLAAMMARMPKWAERHITPLLSAHLEKFANRNIVGERAVVRDCGPIRNVFIDSEATVEGCAYLENGSIVNNAAPGRALASVGSNVDARNFIFEDAVVGSGCVVRNCYVGQGATLDKGFTAHDSLFFANSAMENGEACAFFAGPYTVSMHKASLLIGCQASFMNAGSASNQSNHMYKMGPVHWGIMERGVKTSSNSYLMLGANIGAFSLLMGDHKTHPDSTMFPFSYLFGDERGATVVVPGQMLRSCGLMRDEKKWPTRDKRLKRKLPLHDRIHFQVLSPFTVERMLNVLPVIEQLLNRDADDDRYVRWRGMKFSRASLERARNLYTIAIFKYLYDLNLPEFSDEAHNDEISYINKVQKPVEKESFWIDLAGQIVPRTVLNKCMQAESIEQIENILTTAFNDFETLQTNWIKTAFDSDWHKHPAVIEEYAKQFDAQVEQDRVDYLASLADETASLSL